MPARKSSRARSVSLGLGILLVNIAIVVGIVIFTSGRPSPNGTAAPTPTSTPTTPPSSTTAPPAPTGLGGLLKRDGDITIAVLGDGTGDEEGEWVTVLGELAGRTRSVTLRNLDPSDPTRYAEKLTYGETGSALQVWNGSRKGASAGYAAKRLEFLVPERPDAVLLSYGRDNTASNIGPQLTKTYDAVRAAWPKAAIGVILQAQNADDEIAPVRRATAVWAKSYDLETIDVALAFAQAGDPNSFVSIVDPPSVNKTGGLLWGETVFRALGGTMPAPTESSVDPSPTDGPGSSAEFLPGNRLPQPPASAGSHAPPPTSTDSGSPTPSEASTTPPPESGGPAPEEPSPSDPPPAEDPQDPGTPPVAILPPEDPGSGA